MIFSNRLARELKLKSIKTNMCHISFSFLYQSRLKFISICAICSSMFNLSLYLFIHKTNMSMYAICLNTYSQNKIVVKRLFTFHISQKFTTFVD